MAANSGYPTRIRHVRLSFVLLLPGLPHWTWTPTCFPCDHLCCNKSSELISKYRGSVLRFLDKSSSLVREEALWRVTQNLGRKFWQGRELSVFRGIPFIVASTEKRLIRIVQQPGEAEFKYILKARRDEYQLLRMLKAVRDAGLACTALLLRAESLALGEGGWARKRLCSQGSTARASTKSVSWSAPLLVSPLQYKRLIQELSGCGYRTKRQVKIYGSQTRGFCQELSVTQYYV